MDGIRRREVARRIFAKELNGSTHIFKGNEEKSPVYVLTPLGLRCNRVFIIAALLEKEEVQPESGIWRIRLADPTGSFLGYVGRFQPEALESLTDIEPPVLVSLTAKVRVFEGSSRTLVTLRPENINISDIEARDYWIVETAKSTIKRIKDMENEISEDAKLAKQIYNPNLDEYRKAVKEALLKLKEEYEVVESAEEEEEEIEELEFDFEEEEFDLSDLLEE
ncbi:hypothetical protein B6U96_15950 [Archaeoglobales archaeon ex4484_92]|nr:MAG: hypothetical protein B6U96_15950 [Archaeoglobales archaeon ex4484_92]